MFGCEQRTSVELAEDSPLAFVLSGSGRLAQLTLYAPEQEDVADPNDLTYALWEIVPLSDDGEHVSRLHSIRYGVVPSGYKQRIPDNGVPPANLLQGKRYFYRFVTMNAPSASGYFEIREGRPVKVKGPCFELRDEKWVRVECNDRTY
jgi:hypothetical protein